MAARMRLTFVVGVVLSFATRVFACSSCEHLWERDTEDIVLTRHVKRMQPDARNATSGPRAPLEWGQLNVLHTTDTHGWLEGHIKETNYGADWGDWVSFVSHMRAQAKSYGVDLLLVDTGDLHDGAGLSDATSPNGLISNPTFENIDYDLLTIGNHELYVSAITYEHFNQFAKVYGDRYLTSNVEVFNPNSSKFEYIGKQYRYFTTEQGLRIMAFGVLFDFTGNSNASRITPAATMVQQSWFVDAVNYDQPIDLYVVLGHNPIRVNASASTIGTVYQAIRKYKSDTPIQVFGGHSHIRDFQVYDNKATGLESGRYCETLGWFSMAGFNSTGYHATSPAGLPHPSTKAVVVSPNATHFNLSLSNSSSPFTYSRRYLDWNRLSFAYHANGSQDNTFEIQAGKAVSAEIYSDRMLLNLTQLFGCAPQTWCLYCKPYGDPGNILSLLEVALGETVVNSSRATTPRLIYINSGSVRFDLVEGPFTYDDSFIVSPFDDKFVYIADVPYDAAKQVLAALNAGGADKRKRSIYHSTFDPLAMFDARDTCIDPPLMNINPLRPRSFLQSSRKIIRRQTTTTPGYITYDDFGSTGDDTVHSAIPNYPQPEYIAGNGSFPTNGSAPAVVDVVFLDFIEDFVLAALNQAQSSTNYTDADVSFYLPETFTTNSYLPVYAKKEWQANVPNCPVGCGVGC